MKLPKIVFFYDQDEMFEFCENIKEKLDINCEIVEDEFSKLQLQGFEGNSTICSGYHVLVYEDNMPDRVAIAELLNIHPTVNFFATLEKPFLGYEVGTKFIVRNVHPVVKKEKQDFHEHDFTGENGVEYIKIEDCYFILNQDEGGHMLDNVGCGSSNFVPKSFCKTEPIII